MKIKKGFVLRDVAGQTVVIAVGEASKVFKGMINLNSTATSIWKGVSEGLTAEAIATKLTEEYDITYDKALEDTNKIIAKMTEEGFIEE